MTRPRKAILSLTDAAAKQVQTLIDGRGTETLGIRIGVKQRGCSGNAYTVEFADAPNPADEVVSEKGVTVFIDPKAVLYVIGTEMDFVMDKLQSGFVFRNPNEKGRCGCGESFHV